MNDRRRRVVEFALMVAFVAIVLIDAYLLWVVYTKGSL